MEKSPEEIRADARQRKRDQRSREYAIRDELRLASMDRAERNLIELFAKVALEPRTPQPPPAAPGPPQPAKLPTLQEWLAFLRSLRPTLAIAEEITRVEAAIAAGMIEIPRTSADSDSAAGLTEFPQQLKRRHDAQEEEVI